MIFREFSRFMGILLRNFPGFMGDTFYDLNGTTRILELKLPLPGLNNETTSSRFYKCRKMSRSCSCISSTKERN